MGKGFDRRLGASCKFKFQSIPKVLKSNTGTTDSKEPSKMNQEENQNSVEPSLDAEPDIPLDFPEPPEDWEFNHFISDIAESLTSEELPLLKHLFSGKEINLNFFLSL